MKNLIPLMAFALLLLLGCKKEVIENPQDVATIVMPDGKTWTAQNLDIVPIGYEDQVGWYNGSEDNAPSGRLYTWVEALAVCQQLGDEWRLPTKDDWDTMIYAYDDSWGSTVNNPFSTAAYSALLGESSPSGFDAHLGGLENPIGQLVQVNGTLFYGRGSSGYYWSGTEKSEKNAWTYHFSLRNLWLAGGYGDKTVSFSCRCVKD